MEDAAVMEQYLAAQEEFRNHRGLMKVNVVRNPNYQKHGSRSYVWTLKRFGFQPTRPSRYTQVDVPKGFVTSKIKEVLGHEPDTTRQLRKKTGKGSDEQLGDVPAEDVQNDSMYLCEVKVGSPPQKLMMDFDTGSADFWCFSTAMGAHVPEGHNIFDPQRSKTYEKLEGKSWEIQYGDGSTASGDVGTDTLVIGFLTIKAQVIETATKAAAEFYQTTGDGILGLAFGKINTVCDRQGNPAPATTPVENMIAQEDIPKSSELFTSAFYSDRDSNKKSFYTFGYIDQKLVEELGGEILYTKVNNTQGFWQVPSNHVVLNGEEIPCLGNRAIIDTGTTLALMSDEVVDALYAAIPGAEFDEQEEGYIIPGNVKAQDLPEFKVAIGQHEFIIQKEDLAFAPLEDGRWYGGVQSRGDMNFDILGDTFLKSIYAIWDQGNMRFGAIPKIEKTQHLKPPASSTSGAKGSKVPSTKLTSAKL